MEDKLLSKFERMYLERLGVKLVDDELKPAKTGTQFDLIHGFFQDVRAGLTDYQQTLQRAEEPAFKHLERLAQKAYGRPLRQEEAAKLRRYISGYESKAWASRTRCAAHSPLC